MQRSTSAPARAAHLARVFRMQLVLLLVALFWSMAASAAHTSMICGPQSASVANGGTVEVNLNACQTGMFFPPFGLGPVTGPALPQHGSAILGERSGPPYEAFVTYSHNGDSASSDYFEFDDENGDTIGVSVSIATATSPITVSPATLPALTAGTPYSQTLTASGGAAPYTYTLQSGVLPVGMTLSSSGVLSGTPTQRGSFSFVVRATDSGAQFVDKGYTDTVANPSLSVTPASATAVQGVAFSQALTAIGGVAPHSFLLESGSFPAGISISSVGVVSGTTTAPPGNYPVTLRVTDSSTGPGSYFELEPFTLSVAAAPTVSITVAGQTPSVPWVNEGLPQTLTYTLTSSTSVTADTVVNLTTSGTATAGIDYTGNVASAIIPAGATTTSVTISPINDSQVEEPFETVVLTVAPGTGYTVGAPASATGSIQDDDSPVATISVAPAAVAEDGAASLVYTIALDQPAPYDINVDYTFAGTAIPGDDFVLPAQRPALIPAGSTSVTTVIDPIADSTIEGDETVVLVLQPSSGYNYTVGVPGSATGTILNDDLPNLTINDVTASEGNAGTTSFTFTVSLSAPAGPGGVGFDIATANGSATAGVDYVAQSLTAQTIPAGSSTYTFTVQVNGDTLNEPTETFFVNVTNVVNAVVVDGQGVGTIVNDDPLPSLSINDVTVVEGNAGTTGASFTVTLSAPSGQTVSVNYATADGTATAPSDYASTSGTLAFTPGQTTQTVSVTVNGDTVPEANETFFVNLSGATNATIADNQGLGTISNDDVPVTVSPGSLPAATVAAPYSQTLVASGGTAPYAFAVSAGALPAGLSLSSGGALSGTPTAGGTFAFTVTASDSSAFPGPFSGSQAYVLTVAAPTITLAPTTLPAGGVGTPYTATLGASGGTAPYTYAVTAGTLPAGLTLGAGGALSGTPTAFGTFNFTVTATDSSTGTGPYTGSRAYAVTVVDAAPVANAVSATVAYGSTANPIALDITGGAATSVSVAGAPLHGTATASGTSITYTPVAGYAGPDSFTYTASNSGGTSAPATVSVTVADPAITVAASGGLSAQVGAAYTQTFSWTGGTAPFSGYQVTGIPAGLAITATTGNSVTVAGTPTQAGSFTLNTSATDSSTGNGPYTAGQAFTLTVAAPVLTLAPGPGTLAATYATPYSQAFAASGGVGPYTYAVSGALPTGMSFSGNTLSGTPVAPGTYAITITATDTGATGVGAPFTVATSYTLQVDAPVITLAPGTLPGATAGTAYAQALSAGGGVAPYSFTVGTGSLPPGVTLSAGGQLAGTPTASGSFSATLVATDANGQSGSAAYTLVVAVPTLSVTPTAAFFPRGTAGTPYAQTMTVTGGIAPYTASLSGALPAGMTFDPATRTFSGTPTQSGGFTLQLTITDSTAGTPATTTLTYFLLITPPVLALEPGTVPPASAGVAYSQTFAASGGIAPYQYTLAAGALPAGLSLDSNTGVLAGTPTVAGTFNFSVQATDSTTGTPGTVTVSYALTSATPTIAINPATLPAANATIAYSQALVASGGTAPYSFTVSAGTLPAGLSLAPNGVLSGTPGADGSFTFTVTATDALGFAGTRAYTLSVAARPDPARDPEVRGLLDGQAAATRRFASAQMANFQQRLEQLHGADTAGGYRNAVSVATRERCPADRKYAPGDACAQSAGRHGPSAADEGEAAADATAATPTGSPFGFWTGGVLRSGSLDIRNGSAGLDFESDGLSVGADYRLAPDVSVGAGLGYGQDRTDVGTHGSRIDGRAYTVALYGSFHPGSGFFIDGLAGYQRLSYDLRRYLTINGGAVTGSRDGTQRFASLTAGADLGAEQWQATPYARVDVTRAELDGYAEQGDAVYSLVYGTQQVDATTGNAGVRLQFRHGTAWGSISPQFRLEYQHDFNADGSTSMQYRDLLTGPVYRAEIDGFDRNRWMLGLGALFTVDARWSVRIDYRGLVGNGGERDNALQLIFQTGR